MQVPEYLKMQGSLKAAKIDEVIVYCVNDGAVMEAWEENQMADDSDLVNFMADARCELVCAWRGDPTDLTVDMVDSAEAVFARVDAVASAPRPRGWSPPWSPRKKSAR